MKKNKSGIIAVISLSVLLASLGTSIVNIALPAFTTYFSTTFSLVQWVVIAYLLTITVSVTIVGVLADHYGYKRILIWGIALFTVSSFLAAFSPNILTLISLRGLQGIGASVLSTVSIMIVKNNTENVKTGTAMGLIATMSAIGTAMGPSVGGIILSYFGWHFIFLLLSFLGGLNFLIGIKYITKDEKVGKPEKKINVLAVLFLMSSVGAYALSMTISKNNFSLYTLLLLALSILAGWLFFIIQKSKGNPLIETAIFKSSILTESLFSNFVVSCVMMTTLIVGPFFLALGLGLDEKKVGVVMSVGPLISILTGIPSGKIVDKAGAGITIKIGLLSLIAGTLALSVLPALWGWVGYICSIALLTPGYQLFQAGNNTLIMTNAGKSREGVVSGVLNLSRNLGLVTGASLMGALFSFSTKRYSPTNNDTKATLFGLKVTFLVASLLLLFVIIKLYFGNNKRKK